MIRAMTNANLGRPFVTLKLATSLDGRIATVSGQSQWITSPASRARVHEMRASHDCVLTGIGTVLADDPELSARTHTPPERQPLRAVLDRQGRTPASAKLLNTDNIGPVCLFHDHIRSQDHALDHQGVFRVCVGRNQEDDGLDLDQVLAVLSSNLAVKTLMVEAGPRVAGAFLRAGLVDQVVWFRAPIMIGGDGLAVFGALGVMELKHALKLDRLDIAYCGDDVMETYHITRKD
jgi:diaminohydroxyphosphoribosylaminopyrimidine deaminase / 5-amino-6-(5-phosphoribosylamino)uracil reductase